MPRAKRYYIPGCVWHITHRCHKQEFLLKFARDRNRWLELLFQAKQRYGLVVLNYIVTSNHIHLLVSDDGDRETIPKSMQMLRFYDFAFCGFWTTAIRTTNRYVQNKGKISHEI